MNVLLLTIVLSFLPISELRGSIPYAVYNGTPWFVAYPLCAALNALVAPACWLFLGTVHKLFLKMEWYQRFFERFIGKARSKLANGVERWGWFGVSLFVAIPLPLTGAWTGTLGAWVLGLSKRKTMMAVVVGVLISGAVVTAIVVFGVQALQIFLKK
ncbi:MAG: small multi-drug export protein [Treponema sp.]|jgi:uncharacterized membrane protein|nr:small multi-drug export protein [Treponema sp.]